MSRTAPTWDPGQYLRFGGHRVRPALELFARIDHPEPHLAYDLGCGAGEIARLMTERWPAAEVVGSDSSAEMLAKAAGTPSRVRWEQADVREWAPARPADVIFSNAMLQWVGDHPTLFPRLLRQLAPGGVLAVQMPLSWSEPSHQLMRETLAELRLEDAARAADVGRKWVADADEYYDLLRPHVSELDIWQVRYIQVLEGDDPVLEWVKGTGLRPVLHALADADRARFLARYGERLRQAYPKRTRGETLFPFPRLFIVARR